MQLMYVDESGDPGQQGTSPHYILSALIIPADDWKNSFDRLYQMRRHLKATYGFSIRAELHASALIDTRRGGSHVRNLGGRRTRMRLYEDVMQAIPSIFPTAKTFSIYVDKNAASTSPVTRPNYLKITWNYIINRFHTYLERDCGSEPGMIISDDSANATIRALLRKMRVFNALPSRYDPRGFYNVPVATIIEDPVFRNSRHSFFIQIADLISHSLYRKLYIKGSYRRYNLHTFYDYLDPIIHRAVTSKDPLNMGIVRIP